jgi:hypothetical protein
MLLMNRVADEIESDGHGHSPSGESLDNPPGAVSPGDDVHVWTPDPKIAEAGEPLANPSVVEPTYYNPIQEEIDSGCGARENFPASQAMVVAHLLAIFRCSCSKKPFLPDAASARADLSDGQSAEGCLSGPHTSRRLAVAEEHACGG